MNNEKIRLLRDGLLELHTALLTYQKHEYEQDNQKITTPVQYFQLVTSDPAFAWLRSLSELIVGLDEMCDHPEKATEEKVQNLFDYTKKLLTPVEGGGEFAEKYHAAIQKNPAVALRHGETLKLLA
jgi:hypothetical protein